MLCVVMLNISKLSILMLGISKLSFVMLNIVMLNVFMLSVLVPSQTVYNKSVIYWPNNAQLVVFKWAVRKIPGAMLPAGASGQISIDF
jgi:hypothetical protein